MRQALITALQYVGDKPTGIEMPLFRVVHAPAWESTIPNNITMARVRLAFWGIPGFYWPSVLLGRLHWLLWVSFLCLIVAVILDFVDGRLARAYKERGWITEFGHLVDPFADKIIMWSAFVILLHGIGCRVGLIAPIAGILVYDALVIRERSKLLKAHSPLMRTNPVAKLKQWPLNIGAAILLFSVLLQWNASYGIRLPEYLNGTLLADVGIWLLWAATALAAISACIYHGGGLWPYIEPVMGKLLNEIDIIREEWQETEFPISFATLFHDFGPLDAGHFFLCPGSDLH